MAVLMSPIIGVAGMQGLLAELERIATGKADPYPFYCVLLATHAEGADRRVVTFVQDHWEELDALSGEACALFCLRDGYDDAVDDVTCPRCRQRGRRSGRSCERCGAARPWDPRVARHDVTPEDVYQLAALLGVGYRSLPCAVVLVEPNVGAGALALPLTALDQVVGLISVFRTLADAMREHAEAPAERRLDRLRAGLGELLEVAGMDECAGGRLRSAADVVNTAAETVESSRVLAAAGGGIAVVILKFFGFLP